MSKRLVIDTAEVFEPLLAPARYKAAHGGRGSGKSHFFAGLLIEDSMAEPGDSGGVGLRSVCIREVQKDLAQSSKALIEAKLQSLGVGEADGFKVFRDVIETPGDGLMIFKGMQDYTAESIKSLEGFKRAWWEEAQAATARSLSLLRPTIRADDSQLWFGWNARRKTDAVDMLFRGGDLPTGAVVVHANWRDNPWFPSVLEQERLDCLRLQPEQYDHIWEGGYATVLEGAYYAKCIAEAKGQGRISRVSADPLMTRRIFCDIGGTGAKADAFTMWDAQFIGKEIRVLDYYEAVGQPLATHLNWLRSRGLTPNKAQIWLPHDGDTQDKVFDVSYASAFRSADYRVTVVPNQGKGAAKARIEAGRRLFPAMWFNQATTQSGLDALGWYHEKKDEARNIGLGPEHDWSSHGCFHSDTRLLTRYGTCRIMDLPKVGEVLTPCGWKRYIAPRVTKKSAPLVEVLFAGGYSVKCTPDHLFLTDSGWISAQSLQRGTLIRSSLTRSRSTFMARFIGCGLLTATTQRAAAGYTETLGGLRLVLSRLGATFTTGMGTSQTTGLRTWSALMPRSILALSGRQIPFTDRAGSATKPEPALRSGIALRKGASGTSDWLNVRRAGPSGQELPSGAFSAMLNSWRLSARAAISRSIAAVRAKWLHTANEARQTNTPLRIELVRPLSETADVWDITVPDGHWFSLENGAVVHNSDSFGLMCVAYEEQTFDEYDDEEHDQTGRSPVGGY